MLTLSSLLWDYILPCQSSTPSRLVVLKVSTRRQDGGTVPFTAPATLASHRKDHRVHSSGFIGVFDESCRVSAVVFGLYKLMATHETRSSTNLYNAMLLSDPCELERMFGNPNMGEFKKERFYNLVRVYFNGVGVLSIITCLRPSLLTLKCADQSQHTDRSRYIH
jgi:hypothetical protein